MKKIISIVIAICILLCIGCGRNYEEDLNQENKQNNIVYKETEYVTDAQNYYSECTFADDGVGYYFTVQKMDGYELFYYADNMSEAVPLCSKVNCTHTDQTCDAIFTEMECMEGFIWYENNSLFHIKQDKDTKNVYLISSMNDWQMLRLCKEGMIYGIMYLCNHGSWIDQHVYRKQNVDKETSMKPERKLFMTLL